MKITISVVGGQDQVTGLESLSDWLLGEPELAGRVTTITSPPRAGEMGALSEALVVSAGSGGVLSVLALSLKAWIQQPRKRDVRIRVEVEADGHRLVEIDADRVDGDQLDSLVRQALGNGMLEGQHEPS